LPTGMDKGSLAALFEPYGTVVECRMLPGRDEASKPAAMIRFASTDMATWVVENLNGNIPEGLTEAITVRFANDKKGGDKGGGKGSPYGGGKGWDAWSGGKGGAKGKGGFEAPPPSDNVWVGDLPVGTAEADLGAIFEPYGQVVQSRMMPGRDATAKPCAMIRFASVEIATWVVENLNGNIPQGLDGAIIARFANSSKPKGGGKADMSGGWGGGAPAWQQDAGGWGGKDGGKDWGKGGAMGGKGKKGGAPGSFQALYQSVKGGGILGGGKAPDECQVFLKNLPPDTTDYDLYKLCSPFGAIPPNGVKAMKGDDGMCKGIGFVDFSDPTAAATACMALDGQAGIGATSKKPSKGKGGKGGKGKSDGSDGGW